MTKILLVEDDDNLRGIYGDRLMAEGYEIVAARDGEEALAMAVNEKPDLIISDVMMPKISGFDMLDILRSTKETKDTKVIMMTALSQKEDQERGEKLGANRYLVKSQVTLEDVVRVASEVLDEDSVTSATTSPQRTVAEVAAQAQAASSAATPTPPTSAPAPAPDPTVPPTPPAPLPTPQPEPAPEPEPTPPSPAPAVPTPDVDTSSAETEAEEKSEVAEQIKDFAEHAEEAAAQPPVEPTSGDSTIESASVGSQKIVEPVNDPTAKPDINELYKKELEKEQGGGAATPATPPAPAADNPPATSPEPQESDTPAETPPAGDGPNPNDIAL